jgi:hypothetical protein
MFKNSKKQGDAGLGQAISYFTMEGYEVALPLTESAEWDLIVEIEGLLKRVQVKTSSQMRGNVAVVDASTKGGNQSFSTKKNIQDQHWDLIFIYHLETKQRALIPKEVLTTSGQINLGKKYSAYIL